jgi:hypothetical protein
MRSFPIKRTEAEKLITEGKAELVEKFLHDYTYEDMKQEQQHEQKLSNVIDITDRIRAKQEKEKTQEAINKFMSDYLPKLTHDDIQTILSASDQKDFGQKIVKICWRIDLQNQLK